MATMNDSTGYREAAVGFVNDGDPCDDDGKRPKQYQLPPSPQNKQHDKTKQGMILLFLSAFLFSFMGMFLQYTGRAGIPSTEMVFIRAVFQGTFVLVGMIVCRVDDSSPVKASEKNQQQGGVGGDGDDDDDNYGENGTGVGMVLMDDELLDEEKKLDDKENTWPDATPREKDTLVRNNQERKYDSIATTNGETEYYSFATTPSASTRILRHPFGTTPSMRKVVVLRGIIGGFGFVNYYYTLSTLPLGDATTLLSLHPVMTIFLARFVLGEEIRSLHLLAAVSSVAGAALISRPPFLFGASDDDDGDVDVDSDDTGDRYDRPPTLGYVTALTGSLCASCVIVLIRKAGRVGAHTLHLLFSWAVFGISFSLCIGALVGSSSAGGDQRWRVPDREEMPSVLGVCVSGTFAHFLLNYAGKLVPATPSGLIRSSDIVWGYLLEIVVLGEHPRRETWWGALFVCSSLVLVVLSSGEKNRNSKLKQLDSVGNLTAAK